MISADQLHQLLAHQTAISVIDVRTPLEFRQSHLVNSVNHPLDSLQDLPGLPKDQPVYLVCRTGTRAARAKQQLQAAGFSQTIILKGGLEKWIAAGLAVERGHGHGIGLERQVRIAAGALVLTGVLLGFFVHAGFFGLAGFCWCRAHLRGRDRLVRHGVTLGEGSLESLIPVCWLQNRFTEQIQTACLCSLRLLPLE
jgi:rhodanese-related sulfurtransferase